MRDAVTEDALHVFATRLDIAALALCVVVTLRQGQTETGSRRRLGPGETPAPPTLPDAVSLLGAGNC